MSKFGDVLYEKEGNIAIVTFNRPEKMNAHSRALLDGMIAALEQARVDDDVRVVILTGAGRAFCAGGDVDGMISKGEDTAYAPPKNRKEKLELLGDALAAPYRNHEKPMIAAINGVAAGPGLSYCLLCDIRIASEKAKFTALNAKMGTMPDVGQTYFLPRIVGLENALELLYTGDVIDANEAKRIGLVSRVVPHDKLLDEAKALAAKIAKNPPVAIGVTRRVVYRGLDVDFDTLVMLENYGLAVCRTTEDSKEALKAFIEKRPPVYHGK